MNAITDLYNGLLPIALQTISALLGLLLIRATNVARARWGIEIEARHREALHSAIMSGIRAALGSGVSGADAIEAAVTYATKSVPDAISALGPAPDVLKAIAAAKLREVLQ